MTEQPGGWQPISTAPLDDWVLLAWLDDQAGWSAKTTAMWSEDREEWVDTFGKVLPYPDGWRPLRGTP